MSRGATTFATAVVESVNRRSQRATLVRAVEDARANWDARPWDHTSEANYHLALEALLRFEETRR